MKPGISLLLVLLFLRTASPVPANSGLVSSLRPVHTYSIVARDPATGQLGVAVPNHGCVRVGRTDPLPVDLLERGTIGLLLVFV